MKRCPCWRESVGSGANGRMRVGIDIAMVDRVARCSGLQLLLYCAGGGTVDSARISELAEQVTNWDSLIEAAEYHGLAAALCQFVAGTCPDCVPEDVAVRLRSIYRDSAKHNLILTSQLLALLDAFASQGIAVVPLKGPVLAELLYPDPVLRPSSDLDLLVRKQDVANAARVLAREGYTLDAYLERLPNHILMGFNWELIFHHERLADVDLHWQTGPTDHPFCIDTENLWRSLGPHQFAGREIQSLSPEALLLFLCVHGTKDMWSRLQWLGDVARLLRAPLDWPGILDLSQEAKCIRPLLLGLLLAHELLEATVPEGLLERARTMHAVQSRAREVTLRLMRDPPREPQGMELTAFNARMAERSRDKARHYVALLKAPTDQELKLFPLPAELFFLYYPVRAARLALKYGSRLVHG
jgi:hypothetical protein